MRKRFLWATTHAVALGNGVVLAFTALAGAANYAGASAVHRAPTMGVATHARGAHALHRSARPADVLYSQYDNAGGVSLLSQDFESANDPFDSQLADDCTVPAGDGWSVDTVDVAGVYFNGSGPAESFAVRFYADSGGSPGTMVSEQLGQSYTLNGDDFTIGLDSPVSLAPGTYWFSVQARMDFPTGGEFGWTDRTVVSGTGAQWENPGGGFGTGCSTWTDIDSCFGGLNDGGDLVFSLSGSSGGGGPQHYTITTETGHTIVAGDTDTGNHCDDCQSTINLPFSVLIYGTPYDTVQAASNGNLQFNTDVNAWTNTCLPDAAHGTMFAPYWDDLR